MSKVKYQILGWLTQADCDAGKGFERESWADNLKEARAKVKDFLTDAIRNESTQSLGYIQMLDFNEHIVDDFTPNCGHRVFQKSPDK